MEIKQQKAATVTKSGKIKAVSDGKAIMTSKSGKTKFTCIVNVTNYDKLLKKAPQRLKNELSDPDSLKIYHIHYGYFKYAQGKIPVVY